MGNLLTQIQSMPVLGIISLVAIGIFLHAVWSKLKNHRNNRNNCNNDASTCEKEKCVALSENDRTHNQILYATIAILVSVDILIGQKNAMDYISFASTITSLVLSVVAILMTITSDAKNENTKTLINKSIRQLEDATSKIQGYTDNMTQRAAEQNKAFTEMLATSQEILKRTKNVEHGVADLQSRHKNMSDQHFNGNKGGYL